MLDLNSIRYLAGAFMAASLVPVQLAALTHNAEAKPTQSRTVDRALRAGERGSGCRLVGTIDVWGNAEHQKRSSCHNNGTAADVYARNLICRNGLKGVRAVNHFSKHVPSKGVVKCGPYGKGPCNKKKHKSHFHIQRQGCKRN